MIQTNFEHTVNVKVGPQTYAVTTTYGVIWGHPGNWGSTMDRSSPPDPHEITNLRITHVDGKEVGKPFEATPLCDAIVEAIFNDEEIVGADPVTCEGKTAYQLLIDHADEARRASEPEFPEED